MDVQPTKFGAIADALTWIIMIAVSLLGGVVSFHQKMKIRHVRAWNVTELIGELATSAFAGIVVFNLCQWREFDMTLTVALVGICSHMGTEALKRLERHLTDRFPLPPDDENPK